MPNLKYIKKENLYILLLSIVKVSRSENDLQVFKSSLARIFISKPLFYGYWVGKKVVEVILVGYVLGILVNEGNKC